MPREVRHVLGILFSYLDMIILFQKKEYQTGAILIK
jgi:hypothetical protein